MPDPLHGVLLAAGEGSRLRPLTDHVPKPMLPIDGAPVVLTLVDQLAGVGVHEHTVVTGYLGGVLRDFLRDARASLATARYVDQPQRLGSAHALILAREAGMPAADAVVAATDTVWHDADVAAIVAAFGATRPMVVMGLRRWPLEQLPHRSCVDVDEALRISRVMTRPTPEQVGDSALSGSPIYVFRADFWRYVEAVPPGPERGIHELAVALQAAIDDGHVVQGVEVRETRDITRPTDLLRHNFPYLAPLLPELD